VKNKNIIIAADHAGYYLKKKIIDFLEKEGYGIKDMGTYSPDAVDYPDFGHRLAAEVANGDYYAGISICGTGNGMNMTANKHQGIRSALCWNEEIGRLAKAHNDANICALPARFITDTEAMLIVKTFLKTDFEGGRHKRRIEKIPIKKKT
jgi:ribose 5-phosphate isomerase B